MSNSPNKKHLSPEKQQLIKLCQKTNNGEISGLQVRNGEPVLEPPPTILRTCKFGGENGPHVKFGKKDFALKKNLLEMFAIFTREGSFVVEKLVLRRGLPLWMIIRE